MAKDASFNCPNCGSAISFDETLAGPIVSKIREEALTSIQRAKDEANARITSASEQEAATAAKERQLAERESAVQTSINQAIAAERVKIVAIERENVLKELAPELEAEKTKAQELQTKLAAAQQAELQLRSERETVDQRAKDLELEVARKVDEQRKEIQDQASLEAQEAIRKAQEEAQTSASLASQREAELAVKKRELADEKASVQTTINQTLAAERLKIAKTERENILKEMAPDLDAEKSKTRELQAKLTASQEAELALRKEKDAIDQRARELELEVARKVDEQRKAIHEQAAQQAEEGMKLTLAERDKTISDMRTKLEEAQRKADQGSQQLQGEVLEMDFEVTLRQMFPQDTVEPVKSGTRGGDILQHVLGEMGRSVGTLFWETKRAQAWGGDWTTKAKHDALEAKAEIAMIVSEVLPKGVQDFGLHDGVWCVRPSHAVMLGLAVRQGIIATADARQSTLGRETKVERLYSYMTGPEFRAILEGIALPFREIHDELMAEKRATLARWRRQERRIERVLFSVASLQGDLQGIAGSEMPSLPTFESEPSGDDATEA